MPERDIESLGVMGWGVGWGWEILPSSPPSPPPEWVFLGGNGFFTIGPQNRDLGAPPPANESYGRPGFVFVFMNMSDLVKKNYSHFLWKNLTHFL